MDGTKGTGWAQDITALLILLLNYQDTDGNQKSSILVFSHTFNLHKPSLGTKLGVSTEFHPFIYQQ